MEVFLALLFLIGFWVFVRHDQKSTEQAPPKPLARADIERGFTPGRDVKWLGLVGVSLLGITGLVTEILNPSQPPFTGRWGWLWTSLYSAAGARGIALYWGLAAAVAAVAAVLAYRSSRQVGK